MWPRWLSVALTLVTPAISAFTSIGDGLSGGDVTSVAETAAVTLVGGAFTGSYASTTDRVTWDKLATGCNGVVRAVIHLGLAVGVGGDFTQCEGTAVSRVAYLSLSGGVVVPMADGVDGA
jgi:hypothetical protein